MQIVFNSLNMPSKTMLLLHSCNRCPCLTSNEKCGAVIKIPWAVNIHNSLQNHVIGIVVHHFYNRQIKHILVSLNLKPNDIGHEFFCKPFSNILP